VTVNITCSHPPHDISQLSKCLIYTDQLDVTLC